VAAKDRREAKQPVASVAEWLLWAGGVGVRPRRRHAGGARRGGEAAPGVHPQPLHAPGVQ